jgi:predicted AAA+ superfamily ATPase
MLLSIVERRLQEQARSLEQKVQIIGIAFGGGALVSGVITQHIDKPFTPINVKYPFHPMVSSLFWSILTTIAFGLLAWLITKSQYKRNR